MSLALGFIGFGNINRVHIKNAQKLGIDVAAVADIKPSALDDAKKLFGVKTTYDNHRDLLADKNVSAVVVGTPNRFHAEHAIAALSAGKDVFLEKPMAMNADEAGRIVSARDRGGKLLQMGMVNRFRNSAKALGRFIDAGRCGTIYAGQSWWYRRRGIPGFGGWFTTQSESGGGALIDIGVHMLDLAWSLMRFPKPVSVSGTTFNLFHRLEDYTYTQMWGAPTPGGRKDVDDFAAALIRFEAGQTLQLNVSWALNVEDMNPESGLRLMGDKGGVALKGLNEALVFSEEAGCIVDIRPQIAENDPALDEMRHFADCLRDRTPPSPTAEQGRTVQLMLDAIYRSAREGGEVKIG